MPKNCSRSGGGERDYAGLNVSRALGLPEPPHVSMEKYDQQLQPYVMPRISILEDTMGTKTETEQNNEIARIKELAAKAKEHPGTLLELSRDDYGKVLSFLSQRSVLEEAMAGLPDFYLRHSFPTHEEAAEALAKRFHDAYEELAPQMSWQTQERSRKPWPEVPEENRKLMVATVKRVFGME
jgi:hypothetical protein